MSTLTIQHLDDEVMARLHARAAAHGRSPEDEARSILRTTLGLAEQPATATCLARAIRARVAQIGGIDLELPSRDAARKPPESSGRGYDA